MRRSLTGYVDGFTDRTGVVLFITLATVVAAPPPQTFLATRLLAFAGLILLPLVRDRAWFWFLLAAAACAGTLRQSLLQLDNHHFLQLYWLAAVALSRLAGDPRRTLATSGRLLVGIVFVFATAWKLMTPDFADGALLEYSVAVDPGVNVVPVALGMQEPETVRTNQRTLGAIGEPGRDLPGEPVHLDIDPRVERFVPALTAATLVLEGAIALSFLLPLRGRWRWLRDASLLIFLATTYAVLPVVGFAWLLIGMALATSDLDDDRGSAIYLAALSVMAVYATRVQIVDLLGLPSV